MTGTDSTGTIEPIRNAQATEEQDLMINSPQGEPRDHWSAIATAWEQVGPPLRPSAEDIQLFRDEIADWSTRFGAPRTLILGVTPELFHIDWPVGTSLLALDNTPGMINALWPGPRGTVICGDWRTVPLRDDSRDLVLCDGGLHLLDYPRGHRQFAETLRRIVVAGGRCLFRLFTPPEPPESPQQVFESLRSGGIDNLNQLKMRLCMAMQADPEEGVALHAVWEAIARQASDLDRLAADLGWPIAHLRAIESYRDSPNAYHFLTLEQVETSFCSPTGGFDLLRSHQPSYSLGERCPIVVLQRRGWRQDSAR